MAEFDPHDLHQEAIRRFLKNLEGVADALGDPPQLSIEISEGQISHSWAEVSHLWYEAGDIYYRDVLVITVGTKQHACALLLSSDRLVSSGTGLISGFRIQWNDGSFGFSHALSHRGENYD